MNMIEASRENRTGQLDLFIERARVACQGGAFRFRGRWYRIKRMPKRSRQRQIEISYDKHDPSQIIAWDASGEYLGTATTG